MSPPPVAFSRSQGRSRAPSNPTTPGSHPVRSSGTLSPISIGPSYGASISRPHSRTQSYPQAAFPSISQIAADRLGYSDDEDDDYDGYRQYDPQTGLMSPPPSDQSDLSLELDERSLRRTTLTMVRRSADSDSDGEDGPSPDDDDTTYGPRRMRQASNASLSPHEQVEALEKVNDELRKKLMDVEDSLQRKLREHEGDLDSMQQRIDELEVELSLARRQEKELKSKEVRALMWWFERRVLTGVVAHELVRDPYAGESGHESDTKPGSISHGIHEPKQHLSRSMRCVFCLTCTCTSRTDAISQPSRIGYATFSCNEKKKYAGSTARTICTLWRPRNGKTSSRSGRSR